MKLQLFYISKLSVAALLLAMLPAGMAAQTPDFRRTFVAEEESGTWCGYCPRAMYALEKMEEAYGHDDFISISFYDEYDDSQKLIKTPTGAHFPENYVAWVSTAPSVRVNRKSDTNWQRFSTMQRNYLAWKAENKKADAQVKLVFNIDETDSIVYVCSTSQFARTQSSTDYRLSYILLENRVYHYQSNNYRGETDTTDIGWYTTAPKWITTDHMARGVYPSMTGTKGSVPARVVKLTDYEHRMSFRIPSYIADMENLEVVALLLNNKTGEIVNADRVEWKNIKGMYTGIGRSATVKKAATATYDAQGRRLSGEPARGIYIRDGKKYLKK